MNTTEAQIKKFNISQEPNEHTIIYELKKFYIKAKEIEKTQDADELSLLCSELKSFIYKVPTLKTYFSDMVDVYAISTEQSQKIFKRIKKITQSYIHKEKPLFKNTEKGVVADINAFSDMPIYFFFNSLSHLMGSEENKENIFFIENGIVNFYNKNLLFYRLEKRLNTAKMATFFHKIENSRNFNPIKQSINFAILEFETYLTNSYEKTLLTYKTRKNFYFSWKLSALKGVIEQSIKHIANLLVYADDEEENNKSREKTRKIQTIKESNFSNDFVSIIKTILKNKNITISELTTKLNIMSEETIRNRLRSICNIFNYEKKGKGIESVKELIKEFHITELDF